MKGSRTRLLLPGKAFQRLRRSPQEKLPNKIVIIWKCRLWPEGPPRERLQNKIVITSKCLPKALAKGWFPHERLQNKIVITRECLPEALVRESSQGGSSREPRGEPERRPGGPGKTKRNSLLGSTLRKREQLNIGGSP